MATMTLNARESEKSKPVSISITFPDNIEAAAKAWGSKEAFALLKAAAVVRMQSAMRTLIKQKKTPQEMVKAMNTWKPQARAAGKSRVEKARGFLDKLSDAERAELLQAAMKNNKK